MWAAVAEQASGRILHTSSSIHEKHVKAERKQAESLLHTLAIALLTFGARAVCMQNEDIDTGCKLTQSVCSLFVYGDGGR